MKKLLITFTILIFIWPSYLLGLEEECPSLIFPYEIEEVVNLDDICFLYITVSRRSSDGIDNFEKYIDTLKYFKNIKKLSITVVSPNDKDSTYYTRIFEKLPKLENIEEISISYSGPLPEELPNFSSVEKLTLWNYYEWVRYRPFEEPDEFFYPGQDKEDSIAITEFAKSFSPPPFPDQLFNNIENVKYVNMRLSKTDTLLPDNLFQYTPDIQSIIIEENGLKQLPSSIGKLNKLNLLSIHDCFLEPDFMEKWTSYSDSLRHLLLGRINHFRTIFVEREEKKIYSQPCANFKEFEVDVTNMSNLESFAMSLPNVKNLDNTLKKFPPNIKGLNFQNMKSLKSIGENFCRRKSHNSLSLTFLGANSLEEIRSLKNCQLEYLSLQSFKSQLIWNQLPKIINEANLKTLVMDYKSIKSVQPERFKPFKELEELLISRSSSIGTDKYTHRFRDDEFDKKWLEEIREVLPDTEVEIQ